MAHLIVRDTDGKDVLTRELSTADADLYYKAWMDADTILVNGHDYRVHSVVRTRPERNLILCVSRPVAGPVDPSTARTPAAR